MPGTEFIRDLAVMLLIAGLAAWVCQRLRLSAVVGYLAAGAVIGPFTPPFALVADVERVQTLAQVGLVFLTFAIGLSLNLNRLRNLGFSIVAATAIGALLMFNLCRAFGWLAGWTFPASLVLAGMLMVSSSAIVSKVLDELNLTHERPGQLALGMTVLEDVVAVAMLTLLTSMIQFGGERTPALWSTLASLGAFVAFLGLASLLFAPRLLARMSRHAPAEIRTLVILGVLLGLAWLAARAGYSLALGAFVFGAIVGGTRHRADVERTFSGLQQMFGAVFFVAVGMLVDFRLLVSAWPLVLAVTALALVLRPMACALGLIAVGNSSRESIQAGLALTPLGEFSFVIAQLGVAAGVVPPAFYPVAVGGSLLTSLVAPFLARHAESLSARIVRMEPARVGQWVGFYHEWLLRLRSRQTNSVFWRLTFRTWVQTGLLGLGLSALILFAGPAYEQVRTTYGRDGLGPGVLPFLFWTGFGLVLLAPLIALWRNVAALIAVLAESATAGTRRERRLRPLVEMSLRFVAGAIGVTWLMALLPPGWSLIGVAGAVGLVLALVTLTFWRRLVHLQSRLEVELVHQFREASQPAGAGRHGVLPRHAADWNLDIDEVTLPSDSAHVGKTLGQLAIRARYGCSVVGINRQGFGIVNPRADTVLYPLDQLLLLGTAEDLGRAAQVLGRAASAEAIPGDLDELTMETLVVPTGSPLAGRPLLELDLIRTVGIQIGGLRRGSERNLNLRGTDTFAAGDELLVLGTHTQIKQFMARLAPAEKDSDLTVA